ALVFLEYVGGQLSDSTENAGALVATLAENGLHEVDNPVESGLKGVDDVLNHVEILSIELSPSCDEPVEYVTIMPYRDKKKQYGSHVPNRIRLTDHSILQRDFPERSVTATTQVPSRYPTRTKN